MLNVIAAFNPIGEVKPVYVSLDGVKSKVSKILTVEKKKGFTRFWCYFENDDKLIALCFDGEKWWVE